MPSSISDEDYHRRVRLTFSSQLKGTNKATEAFETRNWRNWNENFQSFQCGFQCSGVSYNCWSFIRMLVFWTFNKPKMFLERQFISDKILGITLWFILLLIILKFIFLFIINNYEVNHVLSSFNGKKYLESL